MSSKVMFKSSSLNAAVGDDLDFGILSDCLFDENVVEGGTIEEGKPVRAAREAKGAPQAKRTKGNSGQTVDAAKNAMGGLPVAESGVEISASDEESEAKGALDGGDDAMFVDRRRERNRVLARKTRLRKKFFFESLQRQVAQLARENDTLKKIVKEKMNPEIGNKILAECSTELPAIVTQTQNQANVLLDKPDFGLMSAIQAAQRSFVVTDPSIPDNPIIFAAQGFLKLTGYKLDEVLGRNCRFLQGPETDMKEVFRMRQCINRGEDTSVCLVNYRADGTKFHNQIFVAALRDGNNQIVNYVGVQVEIDPEDESKRRERNALLTMPAAKKGRPRTKDREKEKEMKLAAKAQRQGTKNAAMAVATRRATGRSTRSNGTKAITTPAPESMVTIMGESFANAAPKGVDTESYQPFAKAPKTISTTALQQMQTFNQAALFNVNRGFYHNQVNIAPPPTAAQNPVGGGTFGGDGFFGVGDATHPFLESSGSVYGNLDVNSLLYDADIGTDFLGGGVFLD